MNEEIEKKDEINIENVDTELEIDSEFEDLDEEGNELSYKDKIKKLKEKLKIAEAERREYLDGWQRAKAEAINKEKQFAQDKADIVKYSSSKVLLEMIPVMDSFLMAMKNKEAWENVDANWRMGVEYIKNQLETAFKNNNLEMFGMVGDNADPTKYNSIETFETEDESQVDKVAEVLQTGFVLNGKIIREAKVKTYIIKK